jgi:hypothetical protein
VFLRFVAKVSDRFLEQRINVKFCVKLGRNANDICAVLSEFNGGGGEAMKKSNVFDRHERFKDGPEIVEDYERSSRPRSYKTD